MELVAKVCGINTSDSIYNLTVKDKLDNTYNLKISNIDGITQGYTYLFNLESASKDGRDYYLIKSFKDIALLDSEEADKYLRDFYPASPISLKESIKQIYDYLNRIDNKIIKDIAVDILDEAKDKFFIYPAAAKLHHNYVGGLAYHTLGMLKLSEGFLLNYPYLNKDYLFAGIVLHDIGKIIELSGIINTEYTIEGQLLGHLVIGAMKVKEVAAKLGYDKTKEALLLEHILISHHGVPQFGSAKKPMTPEALVLWYIDTIDSKFRVLGEVLEKTETDTFSEPVGVIDKTKIYKV